jgi:hypothetical protein
MLFWVDNGGDFETLHMTSTEFGEIFEGDQTDTCDENIRSSVGGWSTVSARHSHERILFTIRVCLSMYL